MSIRALVVIALHVFVVASLIGENPYFRHMALTLCWFAACYVFLIYAALKSFIARVDEDPEFGRRTGLHKLAEIPTMWRVYLCRLLDIAIIGGLLSRMHFATFTVYAVQFVIALVVEQTLIKVSREKFGGAK